MPIASPTQNALDIETEALMTRTALTSIGRAPKKQPLGLSDLRPQTDEARAKRSATRVALVAMPFILAGRPSIQIGLLSAIANDCGFPTDTFHFSLDAAVEMGRGLYESIALFRKVQLGDWLFSVAAFGADAPDPNNDFVKVFAESIDHVLQAGYSKDDLIELRWKTMPALIDRLARDNPWGNYSVVGFTSSFQQSVASAALCKRIKELHPHVVTLIGGANLEGEMGEELMRALPMFDLAVTGEADRAFPELLITLSEGREVDSVQGVLCRKDGAVVPACAQPPFEMLDELPAPNYEEFFERGDALGIVPKNERFAEGIPFESSRGCWWGAKHHCTFCGLNGSTMGFRAKSPDRVRTELAELVKRYRNYRLYAVDNIVDFSYLKTLFPRLIEDGADYNLFYEVKSNLTRAQLKMLSLAGVSRIQPGIESLSSHVLSLMRKGVTGIQNVNLLRWCLYYGIRVNWATIWGFPGETPDDAALQADLFPKLVHLEAPGGLNHIWLERFSPLFFDRTAFPAEFVRPEDSYAYAYPATTDFHKLAYFFDYSLHNAPEASWYEPVRLAVEHWRERATSEDRPTLTYRSSPGIVQITDRRLVNDPLCYHLEDEAGEIYLACSDAPRTVTQVYEALGKRVEESDISEWLEEFCEGGIAMQDGDKFLSLAIPLIAGR